uniref:Taperin n=1 Tax=Leptobrachium leishanense TaxID=445787 RepID=A0A8C5WLV6_9ANUR
MAVSGRSWARPGLEAMPAWKLEVLERKRAKMGSAPPARDGSPKRGRPDEPLVLQDSLGPLNENPFMKKEKERRRRGPHHSPTRGPPQASPIRHLLDMYSNVPGIRTIRADNIIIIESDPTYFTRVAEIRASEVVIYETDPSEAGRVSRLLEKFNQGSGKPSRSRSWENLLDGDSRHHQPKPPVMPKPGATERQRQVPVNKTPRRGSKKETNSGAKNWAPKTEVDYGRPVGAPESSATKPDSSLNLFDRSFSSATPSQQKKVLASTSDNDSFEIRPAPKPDMKSIPENDIQAKALANIRMQSKNSFTFVPKKRQADSTDSPRENGIQYISSVHQEKTPETPSVPATNLQEDTVKSDIPVTNIDDLVNHEASVVPTDGKLESKGVGSPMPSYRPHASLSSVRNKAGNTFTVVPKRKPITEQEAFRTPVVEEEDDEDSRLKRKSDSNDAPYSELGALLKKRYPTVDEIQVIGGYLSLSKTCLSKNGSTGKKMKISFNEQKIQTTYEYPSESSLAEGESNEGSDSESEDELPPSPFLPRATFVNSSVHPNPTNSGNRGVMVWAPPYIQGVMVWAPPYIQGVRVCF